MASQLAGWREMVVVSVVPQTVLSLSQHSVHSWVSVSSRAIGRMAGKYFPIRARSSVYEVGPLDDNLPHCC